MTHSPEDEAARAIAKARKRGEELPAWFGSVQRRVEESLPLLRPSERRILLREANLTDASRLAAERARAIRDKIDRANTPELVNLEKLSRASEVFVALGMRGKTLDPKDPRSKPVPGWLGQVFPDIALADLGDDIHHGIDFTIRTSIGGKDVSLGVDVTFSDKKLEVKFKKIQDQLTTTPDPRTPRMLRVVVGISNRQMRDALRAWGRDTNRIEAYEAQALGACIREQVMMQLAKYTESATSDPLKQEYRGLLEKIGKTAPGISDKGDSLERDPLHQKIKEYIGRVGALK